MDEKQFTETFVTPYQSRLLRAAKNVCHNDAEAEDAVQQTFMKAWRASSQDSDGARFQGKSKVYTWLFRILHNEIIMPTRSLTYRMRQDVPDFDLMVAQVSTTRPDQHHNTLATERAVVLNKAIEELPPGYRTVLVLRDIEGLSTQETAKALGKSEGNVKSQLHKARIALRNSKELRDAVGVSKNGTSHKTHNVSHHVPARPKQPASDFSSAYTA